jgi:hypothetical protein
MLSPAGFTDHPFFYLSNVTQNPDHTHTVPRPNPDFRGYGLGMVWVRCWFGLGIYKVKYGSKISEVAGIFALGL